MYRYDNNNIITGYIKELLHSFNLPKPKVYKKEMPICKNTLYIKDDKIVIANSSKYNNISDSDFTIITEYFYGNKITNITKNLEVDGIYYDSYTHTYLGDYLRFLRDYNGIDLLSMYNCYANQSPANFKYVSNNINFNTSDDNYVLYMIPIKFNQKYLVGINSNLQYECILGFYDDSNNQLFTKFETEEIENKFKNFIDKTYKQISSSTLLNPISISTDYNLFELNSQGGLYVEDSLLGDILYSHEKDLKLFIKLPINVNTAIVVIESQLDSYDNNNPTIVFGNEVIDDINKEKIYTSKYQLLNTLSADSYPFADRLIEYLLDSAIVPTDEIWKNIARVQDKLSKTTIDKDGESFTYTINTLGKWDDSLRDCIYWLAKTKSRQTKYDMIGYVDSDVERILGDYDYSTNIKR